jgi:septum site-determining protein MinC
MMKHARRQQRRAKPMKVPNRRSGEERADAFGARDLRGLSKTELVTLVLKLQAPQGTPAGPEVPSAESSGPETSSAATEPVRRTLVIDSSVRSGQTIEYPDGDVTVIGSVSSGAEIIAGGSIHVYGALRGRAVAGTSGDQNARIFCQDFDAELLSIDGKYRIADNFDRELRGRPVQARLDGLRMMLLPLELASPVGAAARDPISAVSLRRATERMKQFISLTAPREASMREAVTAP